MSAYLTVERLRVEYDGQVAVKALSLEAQQGEFVTLLGPSGCGKTTTLRAIAGFAEPAAGSIVIAGEDVTALPAHQRNIGMVFQSYALFPHLTVGENVAFGLRMRHVGRAERDSRAAAALAMVGLTGHGVRYPAQLSGGQQQRVALARALVIEPRILLLDEPLSNLDANLRTELRSEIRALQQRLGITTILVTHDQPEALAVSDRVAVMQGGEIVDIGSPQTLCDAPSNGFAAAFIGGRTVIGGEVREGVFEAPGLLCTGAPEGAREIVLRGPRLRFGPAQGSLLLHGRIASRAFLGDDFEVDVETPCGRVRVVVPSDQPPPPVGEPCHVSALPGAVSFIS
jgi:ABC-type Fe3+/spermidine/putrescine transport system ATPase subunit